MRSIFKITILLLLFSYAIPSSNAKLKNTVKENKKQYGRGHDVEEYSKERGSFTGKIKYKLPYLDGWDVEAIYTRGKAYSETARPIENKAKKTIITEKEANVIADILYPKKYRGRYRKQMKNARFISHFFENGVVSYEMKLDASGKNHIGINGVRTLLYQNGTTFNNIKVNAYH